MEKRTTSQSLLEHYRTVRATTVVLCEPLAPEDYVIQSMPDASPAKWHLAHTSWFFEEFVLREYAPRYRFYNEAFRYLFNSYYESVGPRHQRPMRGLLSRPTVAETFAYRAHVDERMSELLDDDASSPELAHLVTLGLHHEQQHQELLLTDIKHAFSCNPLLPAYARKAPPPRGGSSALSFTAFDGGLIEVGHGGAGFCFDNEQPRHRVFVQPFRLANRMATNGEFREFVRAGGYERAELWLSDGWASVQAQRWSRPLYWSESLDSEFSLTGERELDPHAPVCHLSYYEADAFARWCEARLPDEFEWEAAAAAVPVEGHFAERREWHPTAARASARDKPAQMFGDAWEWTRSAYTPYPGFRPAPGAVGEYNGKFMVNQLVLRGGSCVTPGTHIRPTYRNFFYPTARWQFSGVRLAKDA